MSNAVGKMIKQRKGQPEQKHLSEPGAEKPLRARKRIRAIGRRRQPLGQQDRATTQGDAKHSMQDRQNGCDLRVIDLQMG